MLLVFFLFSTAFAVQMPWPPMYRVSGRFRLPYVGIDERIDIIFNSNYGARVDLYGGVSTTISNLKLKSDFEIVVAKDRKVCNTIPNGGPSSKGTRFHLAGVGAASLQQAFPDMTLYALVDGDVGCPGSFKTSCKWYQYNETVMNRTGTYNFFTSEGKPFLFSWIGYDNLFGSHFDQYEFKYDSYTPMYNDTSLLDPPSYCKKSVDLPEVAAAKKHNHVLKHTKLMRPYAEVEFHRFMGKHSKWYEHEKELESRMDWYFGNKFYIKKRNEDRSVRHTLAMNHMGDRSDEELYHMRGMKRSQKVRDRILKEFPPQYIWRKDSLEKKDYPKEVAGKVLSKSFSFDGMDWRDRGAVTPVKDQAVCGSCWSFGSTGALESAWFIKNGGSLLLLSQQYLVDCAWQNSTYGMSMGCDGGFSEGAYQFIKENGGIPLTAQYGPYLGVNDYCKGTDNYQMAAGVTGFTSVKFGDENGLVAALGALGPHEVSIDASHKDFSFYASGVYYDAACRNDLDGLDHSVLAVGYGSDGPGQDYWIVKNSWSTHWGNQGYVKMARNRNNNCGVASDAVHPTVP